MSTNSLQLHRDQAYMTEDDANELIKKYDKNGDSILTKEELTNLILNQTNNQGSQQLGANKDVVPKAQNVPTRVADEKGLKRPKLSRSQIKEIFMEHDFDGDGFLCRSELTKAFCFIGSISPLYKAHYGLAYADANGDGRINEEELDKLIDYVEKINKKKGGFEVVC